MKDFDEVSKALGWGLQYSLQLTDIINTITVISSMQYPQVATVSAFDFLKQSEGDSFNSSE